MPETQSSTSPQGSARRRRVEIERGASNVKVTLSVPSFETGRPSRKKVLERARRMLAAALEEEQREVRKTAEGAAPRPAAVSPAPGNGAWWLF